MIPCHQSSSATKPRINSSRQRPLPSGYTSIRDVLEQSIPVNKFVSVIGLVKDRRFPMPTGGADWKSTITLYDKSVEDEHAGLVINIFRPEAEMPQPDGGDVMVVMSAKVQFYRGEVSLLTNRTTSIHIYSASRIPRPPRSAIDALEAPLRGRDRPPTDKEHEYVAWLYHSIDKDSVPDAAAFETKIDQSRNYKNKFRILSDVRDQQFCDVIVNVIKDPFEQMDMATLWVSDYTVNEGFYNFSLDASDASEGRDGDPYGYTTVKNAASNNWPGPHGKRTMQVTCFGMQADFVRNEVRAGNWVQLRNLNVKFGRNANNLEGFLREDRNAYGSGLQVDILATDNPDNVDTRLKEAIRRKRDYEKDKKRRRRDPTSKENGQDNVKKRKAEGQKGKKGSKAKRQEEAWVEMRRKEEEEQREYEARLGLNERVKCESSNQPVSAISSIIEPIKWPTTVEGQDATLILPFTCAKYRVNVRVVDFHPRKLEDFATWSKKTEYNVLSGDDASDSESDDGRNTLDAYAGPKIWEWRFAFLLEEADPRHKDGGRFWAVVDNVEAQQLVNLDASEYAFCSLFSLLPLKQYPANAQPSLRASPDNLEQLREKLFTLWGNLEELKQQELQQQIKARQRVAAQQPPESSPPPRPSGNIQKATAAESKVSNKTFSCCIRQYGVKVSEKDPYKANAGDGKRWERVFGLFGTKISS
ncbi:hypothetical protein AAE478_004509 [Parahypoxylon ruwenzoriense]